MGDKNEQERQKNSRERVMRVQFNAVLKDVTRKGIKIQTDEYLTEGKFPIIDQGNNDIAGYRDDETGLFTDVPAIVFGDHTRIVKYITEPFFLGADGVKVLVPIDRTMNCKYLYYQLLSAKIPDTGYNRHFKWVKELEFQLPSRNEQDDVVKRLDKLCVVISARQQQLAKLDELVKARFVEMFGDVIHNDKKWKEYRFSDITSSRLGKMLDAKQQTGKHSFPYLANANVQWFRFETDNLNRMDFNEAEQVEFSLKDGDLLVCEGGEIGRCAVWHNQVQSCYFQKALHRVRCNQEIILPDYLAWWFKFNCENNGFAAIEGAKATIAHLPGAKLKQLLVVVPPIERQYRFVDFIEQTDVVKVTVQKSLEQMETLKKALMQQYFG